MGSSEHTPPNTSDCPERMQLGLTVSFWCNIMATERRGEGYRRGILRVDMAGARV